jgi:hypothetical protein
MANFFDRFNPFKNIQLGSYGDDEDEKTSQSSAALKSPTKTKQRKEPVKAESWGQRRNKGLIITSRLTSQFPLPLRQPRKNKGQDFVRTVNGWTYRLFSSSEYGPPTVVDWIYIAILEDIARKTKSRVVTVDSPREVIRLAGSTGGKDYKRFATGLQRWMYSRFIINPTGNTDARVAWDFIEAINIKGFSKKWDESKGNVVIFTEKHYQKILEEEVPYDVSVLQLLTHSPGALAMYLLVAPRAYKAAKTNEGIVRINSGEFLKQIGAEEYKRKDRAIKNLRKWKSECDEALIATGAGHLPIDINKHGVISIFPKMLLQGAEKLPQLEKIPRVSLNPKASKGRKVAHKRVLEFDMDWVLEKELADWENGRATSLSPAAAKYAAEKRIALDN